MAGYLGTLFMGGVGLRLVLPPASQFAKLVNTMHASLKKAGDDSLRLSTVFSNRRRQKLVEHQKQAQELVKQLDQKYDKDKRIKLIFSMRYSREEKKPSWCVVAQKLEISTQTAINLHNRGIKILRKKIKSEMFLDNV